MALTEHAKLRVFVDQTQLKEVTSIDIQWESGQQRVEGIEGLLGFTPGVGSSTVTVNLGIPISGQEHNVQQKMVNGALVDIQIPIGNSGSFAARGKIVSGGVSQSASAAAEQSFTWEGELKKIQ